MDDEDQVRQDAITQVFNRVATALNEVTTEIGIPPSDSTAISAVVRLLVAQEEALHRTDGVDLGRDAIRDRVDSYITKMRAAMEKFDPDVH